MRLAGLMTIAGLAIALGGAPAWADPAALGAAFADSPLPAGGQAVWGGLGYPGLVVGYRQGFPSIEVGAVAGFDYSLTQLDLDVPVRYELFRQDNFKLSVGGSIGGFADLGATYVEKTNFASSGLRFSAETDATIRVNDVLDVLGDGVVPLDVPLTQRGDLRVGPLLGGGVELGLGDGFSVAAQALVGPRWIRPVGGQLDSAPGLGLSVFAALGKRIF